MKPSLTAAKYIVISSFIALIFSSYQMRSEVLALSEIRFTADQGRADVWAVERLEEHPRHLREFVLQQKQYELQLEHYDEMLTLYANDYPRYVQALKDEYVPPPLPARPVPPIDPRERTELARINAEFRAHQHRYFDTAGIMVWLSCAAAILLVSGLLFLILFDEHGPRFAYGGLLMMSFVFLIGPSFHSVMSAIVGLMRAPV